MNCRSGEFKIGLGTDAGDNVYAMHFSVFCISRILLYCRNNETCTLHSLIVRRIHYVGCSQSPATFTVSSAYTPTTPTRRFTTPPHNETPQEGVNPLYRGTTVINSKLSDRATSQPEGRTDINDAAYCASNSVAR